MHSFVKYFFIVLFYLCINIDLARSESINIDSLLSQIEEKQLSNHPYWHKLLHYKQTGITTNPHVTSEIISPGFFLSPIGSTNSSEEIKATIIAIIKSPNSNPDSHAQCRFVARFNWLRKMLDWGGINIPAVQCTQYEKWRRNKNIKSLGLVFVTGNLSNPASYYGHLLLKFNYGSSENSSYLLDESLNFGANIPEDENTLVYIYNGFFGGYKGGFMAKKLYSLNHHYTENDLRDMWDYTLNLSEDEIEQIVSHSWEQLGYSYVYYYLKENCAFRMAELLGLVIDEPLLPDYIWSNPVTIFEQIVKIKRNGILLVSDIKKIPSRQNKFYDKYFDLSDKNKITLEDTVKNNNFNSKYYLELQDIEKIRITNTLIDYYEYLIVKDNSNKDLIRKKQNVLVERTKLPINSDIIIKSKKLKSVPPHEGPLPMMFRFGGVYHSKFKDGVNIQFRPVYYDLLELDKGRNPNSTLTMMDIKASYLNENLKLQSIDIFKIEALNVAKTPLPGDSEIAWSFKLGLERNNLSCDNCLVSKISGGIGKAISLTKSNNAIVLGMLNTFMQSNYLDSGTIGVSPRIGLIVTLSSWFKSYISIEKNRFFDKNNVENEHIEWETRIGNKREWDIRFKYEKFTEIEYSAMMSFYW